MKKEIEQHLKNKIIPFWEKLEDVDQGGYYGYMDFDLNIQKEAVKGCILNSRILWFFSNAYLTLKEEALLKKAKHAFEFLKNACLDPEYGGVYWSVTYDGKPEDTTKHTYNQGFAIYALASYYDASKEEEALNLAWKLYHTIETHCKDQYGYLEAFDYKFEPIENDKLSENGIIAEKTMNTLLHIFEAYTELYRVTKNGEVREKLYWILDIFANKIYNPEKRRQEVFFDMKWNSLIDLHSYGHDIETAWLIDRGCEILGDDELTKKMRKITKQLTEEIYKVAYQKHSLLDEAENGVVNTSRIWWVQAEAVVGFLNGYQKEKTESKYLEAAKDIWKFIQEKMVDKREGSEWYWELDDTMEPTSRKPIVEPWKCPYHNGRMCFEVMNREF